MGEKILTYIEMTAWSSELQEIPVHRQGESSVSLQLPRAFLVSFKTFFSSSKTMPNYTNKNATNS